jgi:magnesium transporter
MRARIVENDKIKVLTDAAQIKAAVVGQTPIWVELESESDECQELLSEVLDLHPLTIEDIWATRTQPKLEDYRKYLYMIVHGVKSARRGVYDLLELDVIIGKTFLVTHDPHGVSSKEVLEELDRDPSLLLKGPAWVAHSLLDHAVDHYIPIIDQLDSQLENLIDDALSKAGTKHGNPVMKRILRYKRTLQTLRRMSVLQREIFLRLSRGEFEEIPRDTVPFFRDVHDHFLRINDLIESYRDLVTSALEAYLSVQSNRMNEVMKTLTMISTVMLPLTFIAGVYGMNFKHMPELDWVLGYPFALVMMAIVSAGILIYFRHKGWIGGGAGEDVEGDPKPQSPAKPPGTSKKP